MFASVLNMPFSSGLTCFLKNVFELSLVKRIIILTRIANFYYVIPYQSVISNKNVQRAVGRLYNRERSLL